MNLVERLQDAVANKVGGTAMLPASDVLSTLTRIEQLEADNAALLVALENTRHWFEAERKSISKGNGSQWSMWQCDEQMESIDAAIDAARGKPCL